MASTYEKIASTTVGTATSTITFSSIAASWTDLRLVLVGTLSSAGADVRCRFNSDSATNYSNTTFYGTGTAAGSSRGTNVAQIRLFWISGGSTTIPSMSTADIFSYAGSTYKTVLTTEANDFNGSGTVGNTVQLWRSTSAITQIDLSLSAGNFNTGFIATLYGIKAA